MEISQPLLPLFWSALVVAGLAAVVLVVCLTFLVGAQRPVVLRLVWISGALLVAAASALVVIFFYR
jgi:hypothetical protein